MAITLDPLGGMSPTGEPPVAAPVAPNPMLSTFGASPWDVEDAAYDKSLGEWQAKTRDRLDGIALDPDSYFKGKDLGPDPDTERTKMHTINGASLSFLLDRPVSDDPTDIQRKLALQEASIRFFGGRAKDEAGLLGEIKADAQGRKDRRELDKSLATEASVAAAFQTVGGEQPTTFATWREAAKGKPGYDPANEPDYFESWQRATSAVKATYQEFETPLSTVWHTFKAAPEDVGQAARRAYYQVPDGDRMKFLAALKTLAQKLPEDQQATFWNNLKKQTGRDVKGFGQNAADALDMFTAGSAAANAPDNPSIVAQGAMERGEIDFAADITRIQQTDFDPVKYLTADGSWSQVAEKAAYGAPGAIVTSATAAIPGVGMAAFYLSSQESIYQQYRQDFQAKGLSYDEASRIATNLAPVAALPQVLMERLQVKAFTGKLPVLEKTLAALEDKIASKALRFVTRTAAGAIEEGVLEQAQDYVPALVQDIGHALQQDIPDVQWTGKGGVLDGWEKDTAGMILTMLPLAVFGAGGAAFKDQRQQVFAEASTTQLQAAGITADGIAAINAAKGTASLDSAIQLAMEGRDPTTPEAKAAVEQLRTQQAQAAQQAKQDESLPLLTRTPAGWTVTDKATGEEIGQAPDAGGAWRIAKAHSQALDELTGDEVAHLATMLEAGDAVASRNSDSRQTSQEFDLGQLRTVALAMAEDPAAGERYAKQVALKELQEGGDGEMARQILGDSRTTIAGNIRTTVNRLFKGASVTDVFHEDFHGIRREARAAGRITREDEISLLRALDTILAGKTVRKDGTRLQFIPDNTADADVSETLLDEAFSEIGEMEILRTRKADGKKGKLGVSRGIISRNLTALAKILSPAAARKWTAFIEATRARFGLAMSRAIALKKAERDGLFDAATYEAYLHKMLGTDGQADHEQAAGEIAGELLGESPFSIGKADNPRSGVNIDQAGNSGAETDEATGLPLNSDGTVTLYHGTTREAATEILRSKVLKSAGEFRIYLTTDPTAGAIDGDKGYGDGTVIAVNVKPDLLELDDEFPDGRQDFAIDAPKKTIRVVDAFMPFDQSEGSYSLAPSRAAGLIEQDAVSRIKDPIRRAQAMSRIARSFEGLRLQLERLELTAGSKRLGRSLAKEAAMREAMRAEDLEHEAYARHWQILDSEDMTKLKAQPVHAYLANPNSHLHGRLMSRSAAIKRHPDLFQIHRAGDFDGSEGVNRSVFGGQLMPDQAAQELFDHMENGQHRPLIKAPTADALWDALLQEQRMVESMKEAETKAKEAIRAARIQAKQETNDWLKTQQANQQTNFSPKQESLRALASLDAILATLPYDVRGRIGGYVQIARLGSEESRLDYLRAKLEVADTELEKWLRAQFGREFEALLKRARPEKDEAGQKPRGKIGASIHDLFRAIEKAMAMTGAEVEAEALALESLAASGDYTAEQNSHLMLEANLIRLAGDWHKADAARREAALIEATRVFDSGYLADRVKRSRQRERRNDIRAALQKATGSAGDREARRTRAIADQTTATGKTRTTLFSLLSFEQVTQWVFGEATPEAQRLADWERAASAMKEDSVQAKMDALDELFASLAGSKFKGEQLRWKMSQPTAITIDGKSFSELDAITATLMWRQEDGRRHMEGHLADDGTPAGSWHYSQEFVDKLEDALSPAAKAVRLHLGEEYAAEYDRLNAVFQDLYGVALPRHKHYSPLTVKPAQAAGGQTLDPVTGSVMSGPSLTPGSLRNRSQAAIAEPDFRDALQTYIAHTKQMEHWMAYAPFATEAMAVLNARELGNSIEAAAGKEALSVLRSWIDHFAQGGSRDAQAHLAINGLLNRIMSRAASMALVGRVSVLAVQSVQLAAGLAEMPASAYLHRLGKLFAGRLDWSAAFKSEYIQRRLQQMPPVVAQALDGLRSTRPNKLKSTVQALGRTISGADALFTAGTYAMIYDYQLGLAKSMNLQGPDAENFARQAAERATDRVAQPTRAGARSLYEVTGTNPAIRLAWAFASESRQKLALSAYALAKRDNGAKARALAVTWIAGGVLASLIRATMRDLRDDGEDDELFDEKNWDPARLALAALTGPLQGIPMLGDTAEAIVYKAFGQYLPEGNLFSSAPQAAGSVKNLITGDWDHALRDTEAIFTAAGLVSENAAAATSLLHIARDLFAIGDNAIP